jgi:hypothetical protein
MNESLFKNDFNFLKFFRVSQEYVTKHGGTIEFRDVNYLSGGGRYGGGCDGDSIIVAAKSKSFKKIYVHEFSHFQQAKEKSPYWDIGHDIYERLGDGRVRIKDWSEIYKILLVERDCERRTIKHALEWNLFSVEKYTAGANAYLFFYHYCYLKGKWVNAPLLGFNKLSKIMPTKLVGMKELSRIDMNLMMDFDRIIGTEKP